MRKPSFFSAALAAALIGAAFGGGCIPESLLTLERDVEQEITVPGRGIGINNPLAPEDVFPIDFGDLMAAQLEQELSTSDVPKEAVSSLKITFMKIEVTDPDEAGGGQIVNSLEFLDSLAFSLSSDGAGPVEVAASEEGAFDVENRIEYEFPVTENELVDVLQGGETMTMATDMVTEPPPNDRPLTDATLKFTVTLTVIADPAGAASTL